MTQENKTSPKKKEPGPERQRLANGRPDFQVGFPQDFPNWKMAQTIGHVGPFELLYDGASLNPVIRDPHSGMELRLDLEKTLRAAAERLAHELRQEAKPKPTAPKPRIIMP